MTEQNTVENTGQQAHVTTNTRKLLVGNNRFQNYEFNNSEYDDVTLEEGRVMGRIGATGLITQWDKDASDGSQFPIGIVPEDITVEGSSTATISLCVEGDVDESKLVFNSGESLDSLVGTQRCREMIGAYSVGIKLVSGLEQTNYDNS